MNRIHAEITGEILAVEIQLEQNGLKYKRSFLLVEGNDDEMFFNKFVDNKICSIVICGGKETLLDAAKSLNDNGFSDAICVADKDFSEIFECSVFEGEVVFTDENDLEMMMINSPALQNVLFEFGSKDKIPQFEDKNGRSVCEQIFHVASFIGAMRIISQRYKLNLKFRDMKYKFKNNNTFELNHDRTVQNIFTENENSKISKEDMMNMIIEEQTNSTEPRKICCGHDCVRLLGRALKKEIGTTNLFNNAEGAKLLSQTLRLAYDSSYFSQTKLYQSIRSWEVKSKYKVFRSGI